MKISEYALNCFIQLNDSLIVGGDANGQINIYKINID